MKEQPLSNTIFLKASAETGVDVKIFFYFVLAFGGHYTHTHTHPYIHTPEEGFLVQFGLEHE